MLKRFVPETFGIVLSLAAVGCSAILDGDRKQCAQDSDCTSRGSGFTSSVCIDSWCMAPPKWSCLDKPSAISGHRGPHPVTLRVEDILTQKAKPGVRARLCRKLDVNCENPLAAEVMSDSDGIVRFDIVTDDPTSGFSGYVLFTSSDAMPGLYFFNPPVRGPVDIPAVQLAPRAVATVLTQQVGATYDVTRGLILLNTLDCVGEPLAGVSLETDADDPLTVPFYSVHGLPAATATATDPDGYCGVINVLPGTTSVTARMEAGGRRIGTLSLLVKAGSITYSRMVPLGP